MRRLVDTDRGRWYNLHHALRRHRHGTMVKGGNWGLVKGCGRKICNREKVLIILKKYLFLCALFFSKQWHFPELRAYINHYKTRSRQHSKFTSSIYKNAWPHLDWDIHANNGQTCILLKSNHRESIIHISFSLCLAVQLIHVYITCIHKFWHVSNIFNSINSELWHFYRITCNSINQKTGCWPGFSKL